jgi:colanic acid biosynthesis glycosyl transferase WcaI
MRLLIVSQYFWPENFRINDLAAELYRRGHEVTVLTGWPNYPDGQVFEDFARLPAQFDSFEGVEIIRTPLVSRGRGGLRLMLNYLSFTISASLIGAWKLRGRSFDVIFVNQLSPVTVGLPAAFLAWLKRAPMAMWVLDLWPDTLQAIGLVKSPRVLGWLARLVSFIYSRCDLIFAQSQSFIPKVHQLAGKKKRVEYFPSWAEDIYQNTDVVPAPEVPIQEGSFDVMFAGNLGGAQDFSCILAAAELLRSHAHIRWLIVGDGRMASWIAKEVRLRGLLDQVLMLGRYPVERMPSFFAQADVLLVSLADEPIFSMTIPGKLQSYLAAAIPVVAALNGEGGELVKRSGVGLTCAAGDAKGLADAVLSLSKMSVEDLRAMGQRGLETCRLEFDRNNLISRAEDLLLDLPRRRQNN